MQLKLGVRQLHDGIVVVDCAGALCLAKRRRNCATRSRRLISSNNRIILNLADITYIDSGGLGTLVALYTTARNAGGALKLLRLTQRVGDLLRSPSC